MKNHLLWAILALSLTASFAQSDKLDKKLAKATEKIDQGKLDRAESILVKTLDKYPESGRAWDLLVKLQVQQYEDIKSDPTALRGKAVITTTSKDGEVIENDSLANALMLMINGMSPAEQALTKAKNTMRQALIHSNEAYMSSVYTRIYMVDANIDTSVSPSAWEYFNQAEIEFQKKDFHDAAVLYQKAIDEYPQFYKASLYLGDSYYFMEYYSQAIEKFNNAIRKFPKELEPRKYLVDALMKTEAYDRALDEALKAVAVYPDLIMLAKIRNMAPATGKNFQVNWTPRPVLPNKINGSEEGEAVPEGPWKYYVEAKKRIQKDCNRFGVIKQSQLTDEQYLEVFSWEEMLRNSDDPILSEARKMQKAGFLDCYVLVSCFHYDFYEQFLDFTTKNPGRVEEYLKAQLKS